MRKRRPSNLSVPQLHTETLSESCQLCHGHVQAMTGRLSKEVREAHTTVSTTRSWTQNITCMCIRMAGSLVYHTKANTATKQARKNFRGRPPSSQHSLVLRCQPCLYFGLSDFMLAFGCKVLPIWVWSAAEWHSRSAEGYLLPHGASTKASNSKLRNRSGSVSEPEDG